MKWPASVTLIRHAQSAYNALRVEKQNDPTYEEFRRAFEANPTHPVTRDLALKVREKFALHVSDYETPLTPVGHLQALGNGRRLRRRATPLPDVIFCSPYRRARATLTHMCVGWEELRGVRVVIEDRIREQEHGLALLYNDWRVFQTLHPEQRELRELLGPYWYQYPQGESVSMVRDRTRDMLGMLIREWAGKNVWLITHHLTILSFRANLERLSPEQFMELDECEKPVNCGITQYRCDSGQGKDGKLVLEYYNQVLW